MRLGRTRLPIPGGDYEREWGNQLIRAIDQNFDSAFANIDNSAATTGTASSGTVTNNFRGVTLLGTAASTANSRAGMCWSTTAILGQIVTYTVDFTKRITLCATIGTLASRRSGYVGYLQLGRSNGLVTLVKLDKKGFGLEFASTTVQGYVHDGSSLTNGSAVAVGSYSVFILDFIPGTGLLVYGKNPGSDAVLLDTISTGLPTSTSVSDAGQVDIVFGDTGAGGTAVSEVVGNVWLSYTGT